MKSRLFRPLLTTLCGAIGFAQPLIAVTFTWDGGGGDANWNTGDNWAGNPANGPAATGDDLVFDGSVQTTNANNLPVTGLVGIVYNATASPFTSTGTQVVTLTGNVTNNSAQTQTLNMPIAISGARTVTVASGGKVVFGSTSTAYAQSVNSGTTIFTGAGEVEISSTVNFTVSTANNTTVDMSGLGTFTANLTTFKIGLDTLTTGASVVTLAGNNTITATNMEIGRTIGSGGVLHDGTLNLGAANTIKANTLAIGEKRSDGTMKFFNTGNSSTVTITGKAGAGTKTAVSLGYYQTSPGAYNPTGIADFTGGTVNATLGDMTLGRQAPGGAVTGLNNTAAGTWTMPAGTVTADTVRLGYWSGGNVTGTGTNQIAQGTLNISGGSFTIGTALRIGDGVVGGTNTHARGTVAVSGGTLDVSTLLLLGNNQGSGAAANQRGTLTITGGLVNANVAITTNNAQSTLTLNGGTLDMKGNMIGTLAQPIGGNGGALNFQSGTLQNVSNINGGAALVKTGTGILALAGTNSYPGLTTVSAGTLKCATLTSLYSDVLANVTTANTTVASGATLGFSVGSGTDFTTADVTTLLTKLAVAKAVDGGFQAGSAIGFDTTNASGGTFTVADLIADSTGTGAGALGVTKLGTNTLVLSNGSNTYTGPTTVLAGTLALGDSAASATSATIDIRSGATLDVSVSPWTLGSGQTLKGSGTLLGNTTANGIVSPGASIGTLTATGNFTFASGSSLAVEILGTPQVETATAPQITAAAGNVLVTVTGAGIAGSPLVVTVPVLAGDTGIVWAGKVRDALAATPAITALYTVGGVSAARTITLTRNTAEANDPTLNIGLANGIPSPAITVTATSADTTAGAVAAAADQLAVSGVLNVAGATLNLTTNGTLAAPFVIATYGSRTGGDFATVNGLPAGASIDYAYNSGTAIAIIDATAPAWASGWPKADTITTTGFTVRTESNEPGTAYYVVLAAGSPAPTSSQVKAGQDSTNAAALKSGSMALIANAEATSPVTGLSVGTAYDVWVVAQDSYATPNVQADPVKVEVTTDAPPAWVSGWPKADTITTTGFTARAEINEAGTAYFVVLTTGAPAPSSAQVKAGQDSTNAAAIKNGSIALTANTENSSAVTDLALTTTYDVYFVAEDAVPNLQASPVKITITTGGGGDTTAPVWASGWPSVDSVTTTTCTAHAETDENGMAYYVVLASGAPDPSNLQVKAGTDASDVAAFKSGNISLTANADATAPITGLVSGTAYDVWFVAEDAMPNLQAAAVKVSITTLADYTSWARNNGISGQPAGGDFDNDGRTNLMEYALAGSDPTIPNGSAGTLTGLTLTFNKRTDAITNADVSYIIETSQTLTGTWTPVVTQLPGDPATSISYTLPTGQGKIFARLRVTQ